MLPRENRLSTTREFNRVRKYGKKIRTSLFDLFYLDIKDYDGPPRIGIVVTNKFSKIAPTRNKIKRLFREVVRLNLKKLKNGYWIVIHPFKITTEKTHEEVSTEINKTISKTFGPN